MNGDNIPQDNECRAVQELLVWLPTGSLISEEKQRVERHAESCASCTELLGFASDFKAILVEEFPAHPDAAALVDFTENRVAMDSAVRSGIEGHLEVCRECRDEVEMLETVDRTAPAEDVAAPRSRQLSHKPVGASDEGRRWWDVFAGAMLRPAAAAVYLVIAVVAVALLMTTRPDRVVLDRDAGGVLGGVTIVSDQSGAVRGVESSFEPATLESGKAQFLLLELTGLDAPPMPKDMYTVRIENLHVDGSVWQMSVAGRAFSANYTLCLFLEPGSLEPGEYDVDVVAVGGEGVFHSTLFVE